jgi:predicted NUDIX family NTP pyrophosphohydrolase
MATSRSAGLLIFRRRGDVPEVFLVHPGGPFWARKDVHAWSIPKGVIDAEEEPLAAARRECLEETGLSIDGAFVPLPPRRQPSGKLIIAFAVEADLEPDLVRSNSFELEWPPGSGRLQRFPEVDRGAWFPLPLAREKLHRGQVCLLDDLQAVLARAGRSAAEPETPRAGDADAECRH